MEESLAQSDFICLFLLFKKMSNNNVFRKNAAYFTKLTQINGGSLYYKNKDICLKIPIFVCKCCSAKEK